MADTTPNLGLDRLQTDVGNPIPRLRVNMDILDAALFGPEFITSGPVFTPSDVLAGEPTGKHLNAGYDVANSIGYIRSVNSGAAFTNLHLAGLKTSLWSATGAGDVVETLTASGGRVGIGIITPHSRVHTDGQLTIDPTRAYNVFNFGATTYAINVVGNINKECVNGINNGVHVSFRLNENLPGLCGSSSNLIPSSLAFHASVDSGNSRSVGGYLTGLNIHVQDFPTIDNGAEHWIITSATNASPVEFTMVTPPVEANGFTTGFTWTIQGGTGNWTAINGSFPITVTAANKFTIPACHHD